MASLAFVSGNKCTHFFVYNSLLDTGSPASFVHRSLLPEDIAVGKLTYSTYKGLRGIKFYTYCAVQCYIKIGCQINPVSLMIIPDNATPLPLLIGRDVLQIFNSFALWNVASDCNVRGPSNDMATASLQVNISWSELSVRDLDLQIDFSYRDIFLIEPDLANDVDVCPTLRLETSPELNRIINKNYINFDRSKVTPLEYEMRIQLTLLCSTTKVIIR